MKLRGIKNYALLYGNFLIYSLCSMLAKFAGQHPLFSTPAVLLYGGCILALGLYSILWQQVLKRLPLTVAYANKAITIPLGMLWGVRLFAEALTWNMLLGAALIMVGIVLVVAKHE